MNLPTLQARRQAVLDRVFDHGLQEHARDKSVECFRGYFLEELQLISAKADHFDVEIIVDEFKLFAQRHERLMLAQQPAENVRQFQHHPTSHIRVEANQGRDGVKRIEKEVRIDLAG